MTVYVRVDQNLNASVNQFNHRLEPIDQKHGSKHLPFSTNSLRFVFLGTYIKLSFLICVFTVCHEVNSLCSSPIGTDNETEFTAVRDHSFYLNTAHPAPCSGTITGWRYCYYRPSVLNETVTVYRTSMAIYRRMLDEDSGSYTYERVSSVFSITEDINSHESSFMCDILDVTDFTIEAGDVVGACIFDPIDSDLRLRNQLDIVGQASGHSLLKMNDVSACASGLNRLPSTISNNMLSAIDSRVLHVYADIISKSLL